MLIDKKSTYLEQLKKLKQEQLKQKIVEAELKATGDSYVKGMESGFEMALDGAIAEIIKTRDHWQKRLEPNKNSAKKGLDDDSLVYFEFTKMVLEMLVCRFQEAKTNRGLNLGE